MMNPEMGRRLVLHYEGSAISNVANGGIVVASEHARCALDGIMNALIRIDGAEEAAKFGYALADRAVSGVRSVTALPLFEATPVELPPVTAPAVEAHRFNVTFFFIVTSMMWAAAYV